MHGKKVGQVEKIKLLISMNWTLRMLLLESYLYLCWARLFKLRKFAKVAPLLGKAMVETTFEVDLSNKKTLAHISQAIQMMSRYTFFESECLVQAIAAMKMLERRQIESTLYLGTAKDETGEFIAHAWLRSGPFYITGNVGLDKYTGVQKFSKSF